MSSLLKTSLLMLTLFFGNMGFAADGPKDSLNVLTIGNSFSSSLMRYFPQVVESAGCKLTFERLDIGGCPFQRHWANIEKEEANPNDKFFKKYSYKEKLQSKPWDFVSVQQVSHWSWKPETYFPEAQYLVDFVKKNAPTAEVVIQQTWAYRPDEGRLIGWGFSQEEMYEKLTNAYTQAAEKMNLRIVPTGYAVQLARRTQPGGYHPFKRADFQYPDLPKMDNFLCGGIRWSNDHKKLEGDAFHLNQRGQYLQACVWFGFLYGRPTSEITLVPEGMTPDDAKFLRETAQKAIDGFPQVQR